MKRGEIYYIESTYRETGSEQAHEKKTGLHLLPVPRGH